MAEEIRLADRLESMDKEIRGWATLTRKKLLFRLASLGLKDSAKLAGETDRLLESIRRKIRKKDGDIESVAFTFARHGIFIEHGVGKGRPVGSAKAKVAQQPWLEPVLPDAIEELAGILAEEYADIIAADLRFLIPGVVDATIRK